MQVDSGAQKKQKDLGFARYKSKDKKYYQTIDSSDDKIDSSDDKVVTTTSILAPSKLFINNDYNDYKDLLFKIYLYNETNNSKPKYDELINKTYITTKYIKNYEQIDNKISKENINIINDIINNIQKKNECKNNILENIKIDKYDGKELFSEEQIINIKKLRNLCETYPQKLYISNDNMKFVFNIFLDNVDNVDNILKQYIFDNFINRYGKEMRRYINANNNNLFKKKLLERFIKLKINEFKIELNKQLDLLIIYINYFMNQINEFYRKKVILDENNTLLNKIENYQNNIKLNKDNSNNILYNNYFEFLLELTNYLKEDLKLLKNLDLKFKSENSIFKLLDIYRSNINKNDTYKISEIKNLLI